MPVADPGGSHKVALVVLQVQPLSPGGLKKETSGFFLSGQACEGSFRKRGVVKRGSTGEWTTISTVGKPARASVPGPRSPRPERRHVFQNPLGGHGPDPRSQRKGLASGVDDVEPGETEIFEGDAHR